MKSDNIKQLSNYRICIKEFNNFPIEKIVNYRNAYYTQILASAQTETKEKICRIEKFIKNTKAQIKYGYFDGVAYYQLEQDYIAMTKIHYFHNSDRYYLTMFEELIHWAGGKNRLNRNLAMLSDVYYYYDDEVEEGAAYFGAFFLASHLGLAINKFLKDIKQGVCVSNLSEINDLNKEQTRKSIKIGLQAANYLLNLANRD